MQNRTNKTDNRPAVYKANAGKQRNDVTLTQETANALVKMILEGKSLHPKYDLIHINTEDGKIAHVSCFQLNAWVSRRNVIPETGEALRDVLDDARLKRKEIVSVMAQRRIVEKAQATLDKVLGLPDNLGAKTISRQFKRTKEGTIFEAGKTITDRGINTQLVAAKLRAIMFTLERLDPEIYSRKDKVEGKRLVFDLSDLRRIKDMQDKQNGDRS